jgi:hypothetical protein
MVCNQSSILAAEQLVARQRVEEFLQICAGKMLIDSPALAEFCCDPVSFVSAEQEVENRCTRRINAKDFPAAKIEEHCAIGVSQGSDVLG